MTAERSRPEQPGLPRRGRPRDPEADRAILAAALELFAEKGATGTSMQAIAARAGVGKLTVYRRWPDKEELIAQAIEAVRGDIPDPPAADPRMSVPEQIERAVPAAADTLARPAFRTVLAQVLGSAATHPRIMEASWEQYILPRRRQAAALLTQAVDEGLVHPSADFDALIDMMVGAVVYRVLQPAPLTRPEAARFLRSVYRQAGLLPAPESGG
ncbi:TetR/AcrR family transcriptional regulator [Nocardiopsis coralliicola]